MMMTSQKVIKSTAKQEVYMQGVRILWNEVYS